MPELHVFWPRRGNDRARESSNGRDRQVSRPSAASLFPLFVADDGEILFSRGLPGGGEVRVEAVPTDTGVEPGARVVVERRSDPRRRSGHTPPVIAEAKAEDKQGLLDRLVRIARDNVAIARALQRWQRREPPA